MAMLNFLPKLIQIVERPPEPARPFEPVALANPPNEWIEHMDEPVVVEETIAAEPEEAPKPDAPDAGRRMKK